VVARTEAGSAGRSPARAGGGTPGSTSIIEDGRRRRGLGAGIGGLALLGVTLAALGHVAVQARHYEVALELGREHAAHKELVEQRRKLESEIARLKDPVRIEREAREKLKMGPPAHTDLWVAP
jgi:cell division protein FtsL